MPTELVSRAKVQPKSLIAKTLVLKKQKRGLFAPFPIYKTQNTILQKLSSHHVT
jgi:hypothetical protein